MKTNERIVNFMDAHPSNKLHKFIGDDIVNILSNNNHINNNSYFKCSLNN